MIFELVQRLEVIDMPGDNTSDFNPFTSTKINVYDKNTPKKQNTPQKHSKNNKKTTKHLPQRK